MVFLVVVIAVVVLAFVVAGSSGRNRKWQQVQLDAMEPWQQ